MIKCYLPVVECAIQHNNTYLVIAHPSQGYTAGQWSFPGGKLDIVDESFENDILRAAVQREIREEVGINITTPIEYVFSTFFVGKKDTPIINSTFYTLCAGDVPQVIINPQEIEAYAWLTASEIAASERSSPWLKDYITRVDDYAKSRCSK